MLNYHVHPEPTHIYLFTTQNMSQIFYVYIYRYISPFTSTLIEIKTPLLDFNWKVLEVVFKGLSAFVRLKKISLLT